MRALFPGQIVPTPAVARVCVCWARARDLRSNSWAALSNCPQWPGEAPRLTHTRVYIPIYTHAYTAKGAKRSPTCHAEIARRPRADAPRTPIISAFRLCERASGDRCAWCTRRDGEKLSRSDGALRARPGKIRIFRRVQRLIWLSREDLEEDVENSKAIRVLRDFLDFQFWHIFIAGLASRKMIDAHFAVLLMRP